MHNIIEGKVNFAYIVLRISQHSRSMQLIYADLGSQKLGLWIAQNQSSTVGFEPTTSGLEVWRAIHCATRTTQTMKLYVYMFIKLYCDTVFTRSDAKLLERIGLSRNLVDFHA